MALGLSLGTSFGTPAGYHRVTDIHIDFVRGGVDFQVSSYFSEEARQADASPMMGTSYNVPLKAMLTDEQMTYADMRKALYEYLKSLPQWEGAADV